LAQSQDSASIPQSSAPADYQIDTPITVTAQSEAGGDSFAEDLSAGVGSFGFSGDWLAANSRIIGGDSALTSEFWKLTGESISKWSLIGSVFLDVAQAGTTLGAPDSFYHSVDAAFDVGLSFLGPVGGGVGVIWTATGGFKGATQNPALNQDLEFGINP
jgi:hypothetical protein